MAPEIDLPCTRPMAEHPGRFRLSAQRGRWVILVFYPRDFTFVCPTELTAISARISEFWERRCEVVGISVDTLRTHEEWIGTAPIDGGVGPLRYPLAADETTAVSRAFGMYVAGKRVALRGLFIIDPSGRLQYQVVHGLSVGRSATEPLRVLDALREGGLCPAGWKLGDGTLNPAEMLREGVVIGHYRIRQKLGEGAFSQVFHADDIWLEREVALKVLRPGSEVDLDFVLHEARATAALDHPGICRIHTVEEQEGLPVIVMEYLRGETLAGRLGREPLSSFEAREVGGRVARAMAACHLSKLVHGDIKPANVMLTEDGGTKLLDFGIAVIDGTQVIPAAPPAPLGIGVAGDATVSSSDVIYDLGRQIQGPVSGAGGSRSPLFCGTPEYTAPERLHGGIATPASDVFSFGLTLFQMVTGSQAFAGANPLEMLRRLHAADVDALVSRVPPEFRVPVSRALRIDPEHRATMGELADSLI
jgi:alkyl hydroperoxide reductase subunit AhpC